MFSHCPTCERPFEPEEVLTKEGLTLTYGIGIQYGGLELTLPKSHQQMLRLLMKQRFVSHDRLHSEICKEETSMNSVKVQICKLRQKLKLINSPFEIINRPGQGYSLVKSLAAS